MSAMTEVRLPLIVPDWPVPPRVRAAFTLRQGGVSAAPFDTLNLATHTGDAPEAVAENRRRLRHALQLAAEPAWLSQVHGNAVIDLDVGAGPARAAHATSPPGAASAERARQADAAVTRETHRVCAIQVADCVPVLFAAADGCAVGAAHAGWRGLAAGVLEAAVSAMRVQTDRLVAWLGPAIGPGAFEVGGEVRIAFGPAATAAFTRNERGRWQCDLYALARQRLQALGVSEVHGGGWCTRSQPERFFSYRRSQRCGRMAALIWLEP